MARKTDEEFRKMSLVDIELYTEEHPAEGARVAKVCGKTAAFGLEKYVEYNINRAKNFATPKELNPE